MNLLRWMSLTLVVIGPAKNEEVHFAGPTGLIPSPPAGMAKKLKSHATAAAIVSVAALA